MRTRLKICCIASIEEAKMAVKAGAHALGFVAEMPSGQQFVLPDPFIAEIAVSVPPPVSQIGRAHV